MLLLWVIQFKLFDLNKLPKYLMGRGKDATAIKIVHKWLSCNGVKRTLMVEELKWAGRCNGEIEGDMSVLGAIRKQMTKVSGDHVRALFMTKKLAWSMSILILLWGKFSSTFFITMTGTDRYMYAIVFIGLTFPLYNMFVTYYLATCDVDFSDGSIYIYHL